MDTDDIVIQLALIENYLDDLGVPRKTMLGIEYSLFGRVYILGERLKDTKIATKAIQMDAELCINHGIRFQFVQDVYDKSSAILYHLLMRDK